VIEGVIMNTRVYFVNFRSKIRSVLDKLDVLFSASGFDSVVADGDRVALKLHFGEYGNFRQVRPTFVARIVRNVKRLGGHPFLTDANSLGGSRSDAVSHLGTAFSHGFAATTVKAPVIIADGLTGRNYVEVEVDGKHFRKVRVASAAHHADCIISLAHFKGDIKGGERYWSATLKNIGMGLASKPGKAAIHLLSPPKVTSQCSSCLTCLEWCPSGAIIEAGTGVEVDAERCTMCGDCVAFCPVEAVEVDWVFDERLQERYVEHAAGVLKGKEGKAGFINFAMDITPICDCAKWSGIPILDDIGILASTDPVAVDQASFDLAMRQIGGSGEGRWTAQLAHAERLGLGSRSPRLRRADTERLDPPGPRLILRRSPLLPQLAAQQADAACRRISDPSLRSPGRVGRRPRPRQRWGLRFRGLPRLRVGQVLGRRGPRRGRGRGPLRPCLGIGRHRRLADGELCEGAG